MAFRVYHSPTAAAVGGVARQAGQGEYSKFMQQMIAQQNARAQQERMQQAQIANQRAMQERGIQAQTARDTDYQQFQQDMKLLGYDLQQQGKDADFVRDLKGGIVKGVIGKRLDQAFQQEDFVQNGWSQYVGGIKNWEDWSPKQVEQFEGIQGTLQQILSSDALNTNEKASMVQQAIAEMQGIQASVVPRKRTERDQRIAQLEAQGIEIGVPYQRNGGTYVVQDDLTVKTLVQPPKAAERAKAYSDVREALTVTRMETIGEGKDATEVERVYPPSHNQIIRHMREVLGMDWAKFPEPTKHEIYGLFGQDAQGNQYPPSQQIQGDMMESAPVDVEQPLDAIPAQGDARPSLPFEGGAFGGGTSSTAVQQQTIVEQYPQASNLIGLTPENVQALPQQVQTMLPEIEKEIEYVSKNNNPKRARELRRVIFNLKLLMQGQ